MKRIHVVLGTSAVLFLLAGVSIEAQKPAKAPKAAHAPRTQASTVKPTKLATPQVRASKAPAAKPVKPSTQARAAKPVKPAKTASAKPVKPAKSVKPAKVAKTTAPKGEKSKVAKATKPAKAEKSKKSETSAVASAATETATTPATTTTTPVALTPVQEKLQKNTALASKLSSKLPAGTDVVTAAAGFRNLGQFVAAVNVSTNLGIPFADLKTKMTVDGKSLGQSIQALRPASSGTVEAQHAEYQARVVIAETERTTAESTVTTTTTKSKAKPRKTARPQGGL
jgi:hypothetical protein